MYGAHEAEGEGDTGWLTGCICVCTDVWSSRNREREQETLGEWQRAGVQAMGTHVISDRSAALFVLKGQGISSIEQGS